MTVHFFEFGSAISTMRSRPVGSTSSTMVSNRCTVCGTFREKSGTTLDVLDGTWQPTSSTTLASHGYGQRGARYPWRPERG